MNSTLIGNISRFVLLMAAQILVFNKMELFGYTAFPYILYILLYPVNGNKALLLITAFFLGLTQDIFLNTSGPHAAACVCLAYFRPAFFRFSFGISYEYQTIRINDRLTPERFSFILISVVTHHLILYLLELLRFTLIIDTLIRTVATTVFTLILSITIIYLIKPGKQ